MRYDHYGYPIFPGDRGYSSCGGDVDRFRDDQDAENERLERWLQQRMEILERSGELDRLRKEARNGSKPGSDL